MIYDTFLFHNELDMLELRLRLLYDHVDKFILLECNTTHSGRSKALNFAPKKFEWAKDKIIYLTGLDLEPKETYGDFAYEMIQRQYLYDESMKIARSKDIMLISDIDEIPSHEIIKRIKTEEFAYPLVMNQDFYYYNIHGFRGRKWSGTMAVKCSKRLESMEMTRGRRKGMTQIPDNCGWHFSYFMDPEGIATKLASIAHWQLNEYPFTDETYIMDQIKANANFLGKKDGPLAAEPLPDYLLAELKDFPIFMGVYE